MNSYLARVDSGMDLIHQWKPTDSFPDYRGDRDRADSLGRKSLRTLYMTAMFSDLPEEGQRHEGMQERIWGVMPEMDEATSEMEAFLQSRSDEELARLQKALRTPANPAMQVFESLEGHAARYGLSDRRRLQMRWMITDANFRLRNQPPTLVIGQTMEKVNKAVATDLSREGKVDLVTGRVAERLFWQEQERAAAQSSGEEGKPVRTKRQRRIGRGAKLMGIGVLLGGIAAIALASDGGGGFLFVATVGAVFFLIGLVTFFVGLATGS